MTDTTDTKPAAAILIDPVERTIVPAMLDGTGYQAIRALVQCDLVDVVRLGQLGPNARVDLWVDDEGLFSGNPGFVLDGLQPLAGRGVILLSDAAGESYGIQEALDPDAAAHLIGRLRAMVTWVEADQLPEPGFEIIELH